MDSLSQFSKGNAYTYRGDKFTDPGLKGKECYGALNERKKCIRGRNANMLVWFPESQKYVVVLARQLRKHKNERN